MSALLGWNIRNLQKDLASKTITAESIYSQTLARAQQRKPLNAFVTLTSELGELQAKRTDQALASGMKLPLSGIPIAVKDNFCIRNVQTTCASQMLRNFTPSYSATVVDRLINAGATLIGKTNLDEFGMGSGCVDSVWGATKNAWDDSCVSGGSSGGSAVAVAVGAAVAALGSDTGGSTRNPAAYNGVVGFKPTYGLVSRYGLIPLVNSMDVPGILARNIDDVTAIFNVISGWDAKDSTTVKTENNKIQFEPNIKGVTIGIPTDYLTESLSDEIVETWRSIAQYLSDNGAIVKEVNLPHTRHSIAVYSVLNQCEVASNMARYTGLGFGLRADTNESTEQLYAQSRALGLGDVVRRRILCGNYFLLARNYSAYFEKALKVRRCIVEDFNKVWSSGVDLLLTPVTLGDAPLTNDFLARDARAQSADQDYCTQPANMAGIPALAFPVCLSSRGLPLALQLLGPALSETKLFSAGKYIEGVVQFQKLRLH